MRPSARPPPQQPQLLLLLLLQQLRGCARTPRGWVAVARSQMLGLPDDYLCGIMPASDTGAFEAALWSMIGPRPVDIAHWEAFGEVCRGGDG